MPKNGSEHQKQCLENLLVGADAPFRKAIRPEFIRLAPPLHMDQDEVIKKNAFPTLITSDLL